VAGTCYAAYSNSWMGLRDKAGQQSMQIVSTDIPADPEYVRRIYDAVSAQLADNEQAVIRIGGKDSLGYSIVTKPREFDSPADLEAYLHRNGVQIERPMNAWEGWKLYKSELQNDTVSSGPLGDKQWISARDELSGHSYMYAKEAGGTKPGMVRWSYRKKNLEIRMSATLDIPIKPLFSDDKPSADSVVNLKGVDAYFYRDAVTGERSLIWSELLPSGHYRLYTAMTRNATDSDLKKFAEAVISTQ
jgi:hypothetical protein